MIYIIRSKLLNKENEARFYTKADAAAYYRLKLKELCFPDTIDVEILNDGES